MKHDITSLDPTLPCANGCIVRGTENNDQPSLMTARHGRFCDRCYYAIKSALDRAPEIVEHVTSLIRQNISAGEDRVDGTREAPLPFNAQAFNDANEMYSRLVYWSTHWAQRFGVRPPSPAARAWRNEHRIIGLPNDIEPQSARYAVGIMAKWLTINLDEILEQLPIDDVNYFRDELREVYQVDARWPRVPRPYYSKLPCPDDGGRIAVYPPAHVGADSTYKCERCGRLFTEGNHGFYANLFAEIEAADGNVEAKKALKRRERIVTHLDRKYGAA